jgi:hypothetical protein
MIGLGVILKRLKTRSDRLHRETGKASAILEKRSVKQYQVDFRFNASLFHSFTLAKTGEMGGGKFFEKGILTDSILTSFHLQALMRQGLKPFP